MNLCNNLHKLCPENLVKKYNNCCLYSKDGERRYYYFNNLTKVENGKKVTIIMINPSKEKEHPKDNLLDNTISNVRGILEKYNKNANDKISSFEVVNLFSNKNSDPKNIINDDGVEELNEKILMSVILEAEIIIPAWGIEKKFHKNTKNLLKQIKKCCKGKKVMIIINKYPCHFAIQCTSVNRNPELIEYNFD